MGETAWRTDTADTVFLLSTGSVSQLSAGAQRGSSLSDAVSGFLNEPAKEMGRLIEPLKAAAKDNAMVRVICSNCGNVLLLDHRTVLGEVATTSE